MISLWYKSIPLIEMHTKYQNQFGWSLTQVAAHVIIILLIKRPLHPIQTDLSLKRENIPVSKYFEWIHIIATSFLQWTSKMNRMQFQAKSSCYVHLVQDSLILGVNKELALESNWINVWHQLIGKMHLKLNCTAHFIIQPLPRDMDMVLDGTSYICIEIETFVFVDMQVKISDEN